MAVATKNATKSKFSKATYLGWYENMYRIRKFEEATLKAYSLQKIRGFCHVYIGQEAISAGMESALQDGDKIVNCLQTAWYKH